MLGGGGKMDLNDGASRTGFRSNIGAGWRVRRVERVPVPVQFLQDLRFSSYGGRDRPTSVPKLPGEGHHVRIIALGG